MTYDEIFYLLSRESWKFNPHLSDFSDKVLASASLTNPASGRTHFIVCSTGAPRVPAGMQLDGNSSNSPCIYYDRASDPVGTPNTKRPRQQFFLTFYESGGDCKVGPSFRGEMAEMSKADERILLLSKAWEWLANSYWSGKKFAWSCSPSTIVPRSSKLMRSWTGIPVCAERWAEIILQSQRQSGEQLVPSLSRLRRRKNRSSEHAWIIAGLNGSCPMVMLIELNDGVYRCRNLEIVMEQFWPSIGG